MPRQSHSQASPGDLRALQAKEAAIRSAIKESLAAEDAIAIEQARNAAGWIAAHRADLTFGADPIIQLAPRLTLPELEDDGRDGNAIRIASGAFGDLWWLDPEGREVASHRFLLHARGHKRPVGVLLQFHALRNVEAVQLRTD